MIEAPNNFQTSPVSSSLEAHKTTFSSESIYSKPALRQAARRAKAGYPIGLYNRGVCAIWGNGADKQFVERVRVIKGEKRGERPLAATLETKLLLKMIDPEKVPSSLHKIFANADELSARIGSLCFLRVPITSDTAKNLPDSMLSHLEDGTAILQNWDPKGHKPAFNFLKEMHKAGIKYPAITSMNISGEPEIVSQKEGIAFSEKNRIPIFLYDQKDTGEVSGSYTIFNINSQKGVELVREGNIPGHLFETLFETEIDTTQAKESKYPQKYFPPLLTDGLSPYLARIAIISYAKGRDIDQIHKIIEAMQKSK